MFNGGVFGNIYISITMRKISSDAPHNSILIGMTYTKRGGTNSVKPKGVEML